MGKTKQEKLNAIHEEARTEFDIVQGALRNERLQCLKDRRFYSIAGAQWEGPLGKQFENKPRFEINKIHLSVIRIFNEYRNNRIAVTFQPKDGSDGDQLAETCNDLYRATEQDSVAEEAYDNAFEEGVGGGFGAWRLRNEYEDEYDEENENQKICIEPIFDADSSVYFDLNAKRQDKADAMKCWVITAMTRQAYKDTYDDDPSNWPKVVHQYQFDWLTPDVVFVAEYYKVEIINDTVHVYQGLMGEEEEHTDDDFEDDPELKDRLKATGFKLSRDKKRKKRQVHKYIMSGNSILEDCGLIAGPNIPIVPFYGKRWFIDNVERCMGHVRLSTDVQRLKNMQLSKLAEISAMSSVEKPIFFPEQIAPHTVMWSEDNIKDFPYLMISPVKDASGQIIASGPVAYTKAPDIPQALAALLQTTDQDMSDLLGNQQAGEEIQPNTSGKAIELIQTRLDMQVFIYLSNMAKAVKRSGEIWLGMAREVFVEKDRKVKGINDQGKPRQIVLQKPMMDKNNTAITSNDLTKASFDVAVDVGPSSVSKRAATVKALTGMVSITQDPDTQNVLTSMAMMNMEGEGLEDVRDYFRRKLLLLGAVKPTPEESQMLKEQQQNQQPDPQTSYLNAAAEESQAKSILAQANTAKAAADTDKIKAETELVNAQTAGEHHQHTLDTIDTLANLHTATTPPSE